MENAESYFNIKPKSQLRSFPYEGIYFAKHLILIPMDHEASYQHHYLNILLGPFLL